METKFRHEWAIPEVAKYMNLCGKVQSKYCHRFYTFEHKDSKGKTFLETNQEIDANVILDKWQKHLTNPTIKEIAKWITKNIFTYMYTNVDKSFIVTTDVRLRIVINKINSLTCLYQEVKLQWINWLCELYKVRTRITMEYYLKFIVQVPF